MAIAAGDRVVLVPAIGALLNNGVPMLGVAQSIGPVVVAWPNGDVVTYNDSSGLANLAATSANAFSFYHERVKLISSTYPNVPANAEGQGSSEGVVIGVFTLDPNFDFAIVKFTSGDVGIYATTQLDVVLAN